MMVFRELETYSVWVLGALGQNYEVLVASVL